MRNKLGKSIILGLAALSFAAVGFFTNSQAANASSTKVLWTNNLALYPSDRNVNVTGNYGLYSKPQGTKGAKQLLSAGSMGNLGQSSNSRYNWRAYQIAKTNKGYYYKIVTFNSRFRGWVYGGRTNSAFGGGIKVAKPMANSFLPFQTRGYTLVDPNSTAIWNSPQWTQYKAGKIDMTGYKNTDTFTFLKAAVRVREGDLYYYVVDDQTPSIKGWIFNGGIKQASAVGTNVNNSIQINFVTTSGVNMGSPYVLNLSTADLKPGTTLKVGTPLRSVVLNDFTGVLDTLSKNLPGGYQLSKLQPDLEDSFIGSTVDVYIKPIDANFTSTFKFYYLSKNVLVPLNIYYTPVLNDLEASSFTSSTNSAIPKNFFSSAQAFDPGSPLLRAISNGNNYIYNPSESAAWNSQAVFGDQLALVYNQAPW